MYFIQSPDTTLPVNQTAGDTRQHCSQQQRFATSYAMNLQTMTPPTQTNGFLIIFMAPFSFKIVQLLNVNFLFQLEVTWAAIRFLTTPWQRFLPVLESTLVNHRCTWYPPTIHLVSRVSNHHRLCTECLRRQIHPLLVRLVLGSLIFWIFLRKDRRKVQWISCLVVFASKTALPCYGTTKSFRIGNVKLLLISSYCLKNYFRFMRWNVKLHYRL